MTLLLALACTSAAPRDTSGEADADTDADSDADADADTDSDADADADSDADADTDTDTDPVVLPGTMDVTGTWAGEPFAFSCVAEDPPERFERYWSNAVGDIAGDFACYDAGFLMVQFVNPRAGTFTEPDGTDFLYVAEDGGVLSYGVATPTAWSLVLDEATLVGIETLSIAGSLSGTWPEGDVSATFSLELACNNC